MARSPRRHDPVPLSLNVSEPLSGTAAAHKHWQLPRTYGSRVRLQRRLTMAKFYGTHEKGVSHDGLYAAGVYRHDRRRLLRRLRQSSGCSPVASRRISGFGGVTRSCR